MSVCHLSSCLPRAWSDSQSIEQDVLGMDPSLPSLLPSLPLPSPSLSSLRSLGQHSSLLFCSSAPGMDSLTRTDQARLLEANVPLVWTYRWPGNTTYLVGQVRSYL